MQSLIEYFERNLPELQHRYSWKVPDIDGFEMSGQSTYDANVRFKEFLNKNWTQSLPEDRLKWANVMINRWGGVRGNSESTLRRYITEIHSAKPAIPFKGVASYSKLYSIAQPKKYAIYDARVAACLNAIQYQFDNTTGIAFNYCKGRNNLVGNAQTKTGFAHMEKFRTRTLIARGWHSVPTNDTYQAYMDLLHECGEALPQFKLHDFEMLLFSSAEQECARTIALI